MDEAYSLLLAAAILGFFVLRYWRAHQRQLAAAKISAERGAMFSDGPKAQHPQIQADGCIGCGACITVCPEGDVLGLVNGKAAIINGHKCIGHGLCAEECPVGAITMVLAKASASADVPRLSEEYETSVPNLFIAGELGGLALIKNAVNQGVACVDAVQQRITHLRAVGAAADEEIYDVIVVGAGPAGISASLRAAELKLSALTLERESLGGTVAKYPRQKLVMTSPVEFPLYGRFRQLQLSKEDLLAFWSTVMKRADLNIHIDEGVSAVQKEADGLFRVISSKAEYRSHSVILAIGRAGTPRKLGVPGEELPHVLYRLIEADHYTGKNILIVGGGDSAVEAAMGLAHQPGNRVTLCYRGERFSRLKERNAKRMEEHIQSEKIAVLYKSQPVEFTLSSVLIDKEGSRIEIANDFVWIFAGGTSPSEFLKSMGIAFGATDLSEMPVMA